MAAIACVIATQSQCRNIQPQIACALTCIDQFSGLGSNKNAAKFIIFNTNSIIFNTEFIIVNTDRSNKNAATALCPQAISQ